MRNIETQREFFDGKAHDWRSAVDGGVLDRLFAALPVCAGDRVLDAACGTGVLGAYLVSRGAEVEGIDLSRKMIARAKANVPQVRFTQADFYTYRAAPYDCITVFDAYPHFLDKPAFIAQCEKLLKAGGYLWICFDDGREKINGCHACCGHIATDLLPVDEEEKRFLDAFTTVQKVDTDDCYILGLKKR